MEAKDTLMSDDEYEKVNSAGIYPYLERQAEISFKAGYEQRQAELRIEVGNIAFNKGKKAGMREIVEWLSNGKLCKHKIAQSKCAVCWSEKLKELE